MGVKVALPKPVNLPSIRKVRAFISAPGNAGIPNVTTTTLTERASNQTKKTTGTRRPRPARRRWRQRERRVGRRRCSGWRRLGVLLWLAVLERRDGRS
jgi:hypothetical protein